MVDSRIYKLANRNLSVKGMGTTVVGVIVDGDHLAVLNVGDSRLNRVRDCEIEQITQEHTLVEDQERMGGL